MPAAARIGIILIGVLMGAIAGGVAGLVGGLAFTELARTSGFEGYSGFVVVYWMLGGFIAGLVAGPVLALKLARRWQVTPQR